jgi:hypothetical protein
MPKMKIRLFQKRKFETGSDVNFFRNPAGFGKDSTINRI